VIIQWPGASDDFIFPSNTSMVTQAQIVKELEDGGRIERVRDGTDSDK